MNVEIWSDVVCPWCYLGKRRFERALEAFDGRGTVQVTHRSFQLDPAKPKGHTSSRRAMLMSKYRLSDAQVRAMDARMEQLAAAEGLEYRLTDAGLTGNTLDAHRLVHHAGSEGRQERMLERLYRAYFAEERSVFDVESLAELAAEEGFDAAQVKEILDGDRYAEDVARDLHAARSLGISGVPFFAIEGRYGISGAQPTDVFIRTLTVAAADVQP